MKRVEEPEFEKYYIEVSHNKIYERRCGIFRYMGMWSRWESCSILSDYVPTVKMIFELSDEEIFEHIIFNELPSH